MVMRISIKSCKKATKIILIDNSEKNKNNSRIKEANALLVKTKNLIEARENARDQVVIVSLYGI